MRLTQDRKEAIDRVADYLETRGYEAFMRWIAANLASWHGDGGNVGVE